MIRIVTAGRLRRLEQAADRARARSREVQGQADAAWGRHLRDVRELASRAETAESDAAILRDHVLESETALKQARALISEHGERVRRLLEELKAARLEGRWLLLHYGEPHSIHRSAEDAHAYTATYGVPVHAWKPSDERPASQVIWRLVPFTPDEAVMGFRSVPVPSPEGSEGAA